MNTRAIFLLLGAVLIVVLAYFFFVKQPKAAEPTSFEECAQRYAVLESNPRQCVTPSGVRFVETVLAPAATTTPATSTPSTGGGSNAAGIPNLIQVTNPTKGQSVSSPLIVTGSARGTWYFEGSFPIEVRNAAGTVIGTGHAEAQSNWMTQDYVVFKGTVTFPQQPAGSKGTVVLKKDNPSGDPARDQSVSIPVTF